MATTTNYGWETPDDTDLVKDGALAMRTLGNSVDTTLGTALNNKLYAGLVLIKTQTIGTSVSSVTVTSAFSSTYDNYYITISGGSSTTANEIRFQLGSANTNYYFSGDFVRYVNSNVNIIGNNTSYWPIGSGLPNALSSSLILQNPNLAKPTFYLSNYTFTDGSASMTGFQDSNTSFTAFTIFPSSGNWTGATIRVYGYATS